MSRRRAGVRGDAHVGRLKEKTTTELETMIARDFALFLEAIQADVFQDDLASLAVLWAETRTAETLPAGSRDPLVCERRRRLAAELRARGVTYREIGEVLRVSIERARQLVRLGER